ncbi:hypothetical protein QFZ24_010104 [Streptomyces phaeochromogenes]|nr:hypothetical protein [Streptomyces phaeochromogenes]
MVGAMVGVHSPDHETARRFSLSPNVRTVPQLLPGCDGEWI